MSFLGVSSLFLLCFFFVFFKDVVGPRARGDSRDGAARLSRSRPHLKEKKTKKTVSKSHTKQLSITPPGHRSRWMVVALTRLSPSWPEPVPILSLSLSGIEIALSDLLSRSFPTSAHHLPCDSAALPLSPPPPRWPLHSEIGDIHSCHPLNSNRTPSSSPQAPGLMR